MTTIRDAAELCLDSFDHFYRKSSNKSDPAVFAAVQDQYQRFKIWSSNIGVFAELHASLDFRVREYDDIRETFLGHLKVIESRLGELNNLSDPQSPAASASPDQDAGLDARSYNSESSDSQSDRSAEFYSWSALELIQSTSHNIDWLHKLSNLVRKASFSNQTRKANAHRLDDELGNDMTGLLTQWFCVLVERQFQNIDKDSNLLKRLAASMVLRRRQIEYRQSRQKRWDLRQEAYIRQREPKQSLEVNTIMSPEPIAVGILTQQPTASASRVNQQSGDAAAQSVMKTTTLDRKLFHKLAAPSNISQGTSAPLHVNSRVLVPPAPRPSGANGDFVCEYCCLVLDGKLGRDRERWVKHVKRDLHPYICVADHCDDDLELFSTQHEWLLHMQTRHLAQWHCAHKSHPSSVIFESEEQFKTHMRKVHAGKFDEDQLSVVAESSIRPQTPAFQACPLCSDSPDHLEDHIGSHLRDLALLSLPWPKDTDANRDCTTEADSSQRDLRSTMRDFQSEGSLDSLFLDERNEPENVLNSEDMEPERLASYLLLCKAVDQRKAITLSGQIEDPILDAIGSYQARMRKSVRINAEKAGRELSNCLAKHLVNGYPESRKYVPRSCFEKQITRATIKRCLPDAQDELLDFIWNSAQKLFAILLYSDCLPRDIDLESALQTFKNRQLTDDQLPLPRHTEKCTCMENQGFCPHKVPRETLVEWSLRGWEHFYADQWKFLAPEFETGEFDYVLDEQSVLPIQLRDGHGEGSFGEVREGELNEDHARESERRGESRHIAIKSFKRVYENDPQGLSARRSWKTEAQDLRELSERNHPHLVRRIATVVHGKQFLIISDWANGGDLKNFWEQERKPSLMPKLVLEVVTQLSGLASAIELMHHGNYIGTPLSRSVSQYPSSHTPSTPVVVGPDGKANRVADMGVAAEDSNWRHGDLKPENILRFLKAGELVGTLRISDLGLAKRHVEATGLRKLPSTSHFGTLNYEPPEAMTRLLSPRSRLYDIWSFGCIMLEFVVWLLYGREGLDEFWKLPVQRDGTLFWSRLPVGEEPGAEVNSSVVQVIDGILATNPACRSPSALRDLLLLVKDRVLVPALPGVHNTIPPGNRRIQADVLLKALEDIENRCKSPQYCCSGQPERNARLPTNTLQRIP